MGKPQIVWARRARKVLLQKLGGCCSFCGTRSDLTFDCIDPNDRCHADRLGNHDRMPYYHRQYRAANVQILCRHCNAVKRNRRNYWPPFNRHVKRRYLAMRRAAHRAAPPATAPAEQPTNSQLSTLNFPNDRP